MRQIAAAVVLGLLALSGSMAGEVAKTSVPGSPDSLAKPMAGQYILGLALVDAASDKPAVRLAINAPLTDRLYRLSAVRAE